MRIIESKLRSMIGKEIKVVGKKLKCIPYYDEDAKGIVGVLLDVDASIGISVRTRQGNEMVLGREIITDIQEVL